MISRHRPGFLGADGQVSPSLVPVAACQACREDPVGGLRALQWGG